MTAVRSGRRPYDYDVAVIGAGPAGLAAAIRARWLKGFDPWPSSVVVFDPGPLGGLGRWGSCVLTGPGWSLSGAELTDRLAADVESLAIPVVGEAVTHVERDGPYLLLRAGDHVVRALAIVLASGLRTLANEDRHFPDGVTIAMKGRAHLRSLVGRAIEAGRKSGLVVIGNAHTTLLVPLFAELGGSVAIRWIVEPSTTLSTPVAGDGHAGLPHPTLHGRLAAVEGDERVEGVTIVTPDGPVQLACSSVFIDYHAFELRPAVSVQGLGHLGIRATGEGFVETDAWNETRAAGIFAAGDVTGRYASTLTALGDGVSAGFGAHRHAFRAKFGREPDLFAYRGLARPLASEGERGPAIAVSDVPVLVGVAQRAQATLERVLSPAAASEVVGAIDTRDTSVGELCARAHTPRAQLETALRAAVQAREIVLHREPAPAGSPPGTGFR